MAIVKADAYGHGAIQVARLLEGQCAFFGVSSMLEAMELRQAGLKTPILILGHTPVKAFPQAIREGIRPAIYSLEDARAFSAAAQELKTVAPFHFAVDTGKMEGCFHAQFLCGSGEGPGILQSEDCRTDSLLNSLGKSSYRGMSQNQNGRL